MENMLLSFHMLECRAEFRREPGYADIIEIYKGTLVRLSRETGQPVLSVLNDIITTALRTGSPLEAGWFVSAFVELVLPEGVPS